MEFVARFLQLVIDLSCAQEDLSGLFGSGPLVWKNALKPATREFAQLRRCGRLPQKAFRSHDNQGLSPAPQNLSPQEMKVLCGCCRPRHLKVVFGSQLKESFHASAGMFGSCTFK